MSSFSRWKKVELLDLAEKLRLPNVGNNVRKSDLIAMIEEHLNVLNEPLDVEVDYPELKSFYDAIVVKHETEEAEAEEVEGEEAEDQLPERVLDGFNKLDFSEESDEDSTFKFAFEDYLSDVAVQVQKLNESLQDSLSTIQSVDALFYLVEFYFVVRPLVARQDAWLSSSTLVTWAVFSAGVPALVGYYVNFIRYELPEVQVDPMVFHLAKFLVGLGILNVELDASGSGWQLFFKLGLTSWVHYLGQLPLVFGLVGALLTIYIF
ncbi:hypothetical protein HG536_0G03570 [Torulaspora globosa]|uniref:Uncharacterized protein n=1 Tax=Torulaspora globosa TaxID=48254 RepID=A0A7G3ZLV9_9SACH|nr:uncharacterized protein HG536_0G03570 [Torulaspora globosa]QLL34495.1 hypothetical protein HG536_0G03570 [Torulaspora globosa]